MRLQKLSVTVILVMLISFCLSVSILAQQVSIGDSISKLKEKEQIGSSDFRKLADEYKNDYNIYAISISSDDQHFPSSTADMPKDIVNLRKEIKGSRLSEADIKKTYFSTLQSYSTYFIMDKGNRLFLLVAENKTKQASTEVKGTLQASKIFEYIKYGCLVLFLVIGCVFAPKIVTRIRKKFERKDKPTGTGSPPEPHEVKIVKLVDEYFTLSELTSDECILRIHMFIRTLEEMLLNIKARITSAKYYHEMNSPLNKDTEIIRESFRLNDELRKHETSYDNSCINIRDVKEELNKLHNYNDEKYKKTQIMLVIQDVTITYKKTQEQLIHIEGLIDSILDFKVKCLADLFGGNNYLTLEVNSTMFNIFAEQMKSYIDNISSIVKKSVSGYEKEQAELKESLVKLSKYIEDKNDQYENISNIHKMLDNKINSLVKQYGSLSDKIKSIDTGEAEGQVNRVLKEFNNLQDNIDKVVKSISIKDSHLENKIDSISEQVSGIEVSELKDIFKILKEQKQQFESMKTKITDLEYSIAEDSKFNKEIKQLESEGNENIEIISDNFEKNLLPYFNEAKKSIYIVMYDFSSDAIIRRLENVPWNVPIKIVMDKEKGLERRHKFKKLYDRKNFELRVYKNEEGGFMHRKSTIIDSSTTITGSLNFTFSAVERERNDEHVIILKNKLKVDKFLKDFDEIYRNSQIV